MKTHQRAGLFWMIGIVFVILIWIIGHEVIPGMTQAFQPSDIISMVIAFFIGGILFIIGDDD